MVDTLFNKNYIQSIANIKSLRQSNHCTFRFNYIMSKKKKKEITIKKYLSLKSKIL